jgi:hypothetical protein
MEWFAMTTFSNQTSANIYIVMGRKISQAQRSRFHSLKFTVPIVLHHKPLCCDTLMDPDRAAALEVHQKGERTPTPSTKHPLTKLHPSSRRALHRPIDMGHHAVQRRPTICQPTRSRGPRHAPLPTTQRAEAKREPRVLSLGLAKCVQDVKRALVR